MVFTVAVAVLVLYLAIARPDIQEGVGTSESSERSMTVAFEEGV